MNFLDADVPDPTDFPAPSAAPGLQALDASFRCDICQELLDAPVTVACGHCFCSKCLREALYTKQECPSCRRPTEEVHIRTNPVLEKAIGDWKLARPFILQLIKERENDNSAAAGDQDLSRKRKRSPSRASSSEPVIIGSSSNPLSPNGKSLRPSSPSSRQKKAKTKREQPGAEGGEVIPEVVECPACRKNVRYELINSHMDNNCKDRTVGKSAASGWSKLMNGGGKSTSTKAKNKRRADPDDSDDGYPLPIQTYTTLKDRQLKEMLSEQDLPVNGDRSNWEQRHKRWVMLYNANLDRSLVNRKPKHELRKELKKWEEEQARKRKPVVQDAKSYQRLHNNEFKKLIAEARPRLPVDLAPVASDESNVTIASVPTTPTKQRPLRNPLTEELDNLIVVDSVEEQQIKLTSLNVSCI